MQLPGAASLLSGCVVLVISLLIATDHDQSSGVKAVICERTRHFRRVSRVGIFSMWIKTGICDIVVQCALTLTAQIGAWWLAGNRTTSGPRRQTASLDSRIEEHEVLWCAEKQEVERIIASLEVKTTCFDLEDVAKS